MGGRNWTAIEFGDFLKNNLVYDLSLIYFHSSEIGSISNEIAKRASL